MILVFREQIDVLFSGFENVNDIIEHAEYLPPTAEIKNYNVMIHGQNFFDQPVKNNLRTYDSIRRIPTGQKDD